MDVNVNSIYNFVLNSFTVKITSVLQKWNECQSLAI